MALLLLTVLLMVLLMVLLLMVLVMVRAIAVVVVFVAELHLVGPQCPALVAGLLQCTCISEGGAL
jgi:hypothetical protein